MPILSPLRADQKYPQAGASGLELQVSTYIQRCRMNVIGTIALVILFAAIYAVVDRRK